MKRITISLMLFALSGWALIAYAAEEPASPNVEDGVRINILEDGEAIVGSFEDGMYARLYGFNGTAGDRVTVTMTQEDDSGLDPYLVLLGPFGEVIATDDDSGEVGFSAAINDVLLPESGGYFVLATTWNSVDMILEEEAADGAEFEISVSGMTTPTDLPDFNPNTIQYFAGDPIPGESVGGSSTEEEPVFYYTLPAQEGEVYDILLTSPDFDTVLHVFGPGGDRIAVNDDDARTGSLDSGIYDLEIPVTGDYLIFATNVFFYRVNDPFDTESVLNYEGGDFELFVSDPR